MSRNSGIQGVIDGKLAACPRTPNCVSSTHTDLNRYMAPIEYDGFTLEEAKKILVEVLGTLPKIEIKKNDGQYIYAEAKTFVFEFFNDVEFYFDEEEKVIHFRSASRLGFADLGTNKRRIQSVVARFYNRIDELKRKN
ncbi:uncharacterized protein (DUF1499 family) [Pullulanibacillus pueri]|uniref:DUF1499 domain-containing protein n=1 Tax=Pullulanibacillus pueri TaxID=1437324 RepID=A0A8J2ZYU1_9BACL|nr:DUF1499 domain-containing protein [Pullulanibacillus pueri]MBM7683183.1 uncharacterized protein (DUF1499 family) [Pullulanibacillus pueri]GGH85642.1 hypothetical protein GCM10007096_31510 [Pullulanibacillus pueri]